MKKLFFLSMLSLMFVLTSCSDNSRSLSSSTVEDLVSEKIEASQKEQGYISIPVGFFELKNKQVRYQLARLAKANIITYKVKCFDWWNKTLRISSSFWGDTYGSVNYYEEKHVFVDVKLTEEGRKLCVDSIPSLPDFIDEGMEQPKVDLTKFPENSLTFDSYTAEYENWPEIPYPAKSEAPNVHKDESNLFEEILDESKPQEEEETPEDYFDRNNKYLEEVEKIKQSDDYQVLSLDIEASQGYEDAKNMENRKMVNMKAYKIEVENARFIKTIDKKDEGLTASAEVVFKYVDVTPACRAWYHTYEDQLLCAKVDLVYYDDMGWLLLTDKLKLSSESDLAPLTDKTNLRVQGLVGY